MLPLTPATADYNAAFVTYWQRAGVPLHLWGADARGARLPLEVTVHRARGPVAEGTAGAAGDILLRLRPRAGAGTPADADLRRCLAAAAARGDGVIVTDRHEVIVDINEAASRLTGLTPARACGQRLADVLRSGMRVADGAGAGRPVWRWSVDGASRHVEPSMRPFVDRDGRITHHVHSLRDVSARVQADDLLQRLAHHDFLTGLPNRALFDDRLRREVARHVRHGNGFALAYLDVDRFKAINDTHGHDAGDRVLLRVAQRIARGLRDEDTVARLGGDEFALLLSGCAGRADIATVLDAILLAVRSPLRLADGTLLRPSASIGVACFPADGTDADRLLQAADAAMYRAKRAGGHRVAYAEPPADGSPRAGRLSSVWGLLAGYRG